LKVDAYEANSKGSFVDDNSMMDPEIINFATQHDLPIFVSIDGSLDNKGITTTTVSVVARDIKDKDKINCLEWQNRLGKVLLIRTWCLPKNWGTRKESINMAEAIKESINMAEAIGFIIGEYTIPLELPIIYITDSNNARTLQWNIKIIDEFTNRKKVSCVKQGIEYPIAKHLQYLTCKWPRVDQQS
jgi:hypothetical protein